ncbi:MAG: FHA domain-containing protein [Promicromonosporaceae bacterium]|nr:FHA domain-containing protein [Promicromonosporaceae bacterium]
MGELTFNLLQYGFLLLLWLFVLSAIAVLRRDLRTRADGQAGGPTRRGRRKAAGASAPKAPRRPTRLTVTAGGLQGTQLPLTNASILIGRQPGCTLVLEDDYASSRHARIFPQDDQWYLEDLNSTNGTFLDDQPVHGTVPLPPGTPVQIGRTVVELQA